MVQSSVSKIVIMVPYLNRSCDGPSPTGRDQYFAGAYLVISVEQT